MSDTTNKSIRTAQAKRFWDMGVGRKLGKTSFAAYLTDIPKVPADPLTDDTAYPYFILAEPRLGLKRLCELGGVVFDGNDETFIAYDKAHREFTQPTWIRIQDGRKNRNRTVRDCRKSFGKDERGLTALQGVCAYLQHPTVLSEATQADAHVMDLSGSVRRDGRADAASLELWDGQPELLCHWDGIALPLCGAASRRDCKAL